MNNQKSYINSRNALYLVPTPIGNLDDMTFRAVDTLKKADYIYCEDTRVTYNLLSHFNIITTPRSYHIFNEDVCHVEILEHLSKGANVALVSDAGMPVISDPGYLVVRKALDEGYNVIGLPGANAGLTALIASGIPCENFTFVGFLNHKSTQKTKELEQLADHKGALIIYEAPHRIMDTLETIYRVMGNREICLARELTKKYEEYFRGKVADIISFKPEIKGEIVLIIKPGELSVTQTNLNNKSYQEHYKFYLDQNISEKEAMKKVAKDRNVSKSEVYKQLLNK